MVAGAVQAAITTPSDLLKIRMQLQPHAPGSPSFIGARRMLRNVVKAEGVRGECPQPSLSNSQMYNTVASELRVCMTVSENAGANLPYICGQGGKLAQHAAPTTFVAITACCAGLQPARLVMHSAYSTLSSHAAAHHHQAWGFTRAIGANSV